MTDIDRILFSKTLHPAPLMRIAVVISEMFPSIAFDWRGIMRCKSLYENNNIAQTDAIT